jgi:cytochrome c oxidase assembly factor CtaG
MIEDIIITSIIVIYLIGYVLAFWVAYKDQRKWKLINTFTLLDFVILLVLAVFSWLLIFVHCADNVVLWKDE